MHPFAVETAALWYTASLDFHCAPIWLLWQLPSCSVQNESVLTDVSESVFAGILLP